MAKELGSNMDEKIAPLSSKPQYLGSIIWGNLWYTFLFRSLVPVHILYRYRSNFVHLYVFVQKSSMVDPIVTKIEINAKRKPIKFCYKSPLNRVDLIVTKIERNVLMYWMYVLCSSNTTKMGLFYRLFSLSLPLIYILFALDV